MTIDIEENKKKLIRWVKSYIKSEKNAAKVDDFLAFLENSDFYTAPATANHQLNCEGGLCQHTLNVILRMFKECNNEHSEDEIQTAEYKEKVFLVALLHDLGKTNLYQKTTKKKKNNQGKIIEIPVWKEVQDFPMGYSEKSLLIAIQYFVLTDEELKAIRWHRGNYLLSMLETDFNLDDFYSKNPLAFYLGIAAKKARLYDEEKINY